MSEDAIEFLNSLISGVSELGKLDKATIGNRVNTLSAKNNMSRPLSERVEQTDEGAKTRADLEAVKRKESLPEDADIEGMTDKWIDDIVKNILF